jgi:hypothetical protein
MDTECKRFACKVCGNGPDRDGFREHGRGCYTQDEDGGGWDYVEEADETRNKGTVNGAEKEKIHYARDREW